MVGEMKRHAVLTACLLTFAVMYTAMTAVAEVQDFQQVCIELLEAGPARYLQLQAHGRSAAEIDTLLADMYHANGLKPYWLDGDSPSDRAKGILAVLDDAASQGLDPDDYFTGMIHDYWKRRDVAGLVRLDILLSLGMMRYVADQREGRLVVHEIDPKLFATARNAEVDWRQLFQEAFAAKDMKQFLDEQAPPFRQYVWLMKKLAEYRVLVALGGWGRVGDGDVLKPGMTDSRIPSIKKRLGVTGELALTGEFVGKDIPSDVYDPAMEDGVKSFQRHHGLEQDGIIGRQTLAAMNVPAEKRVKQIIINMERYRWLDRSILNNRQVVVNIAGFTASAATSGKLELVMPVVVGKEYLQTPVFNDTITYIEFNPYWTVPPSIASKETLPRLRKNSRYLVERRMRLFSGWDESARELDSTKITWRNVTPQQMRRYRIRQDPGPGNDLGTLKIMFPNPYHVYLHDTPHRDLFARDRRAFSHGCIRLGKPVEMASWLLGGIGGGWSVERIRQLIGTGERKVVVLDDPVPIHIIYRTAVVNQNDNSIIFYDDIYGRDRLVAKALFGTSG